MRSRDRNSLTEAVSALRPLRPCASLGLTTTGP